MSVIKNITLGILHGLWDSIAGMALVLHIDNEVNRQKSEIETLRQLRLMEHNRHLIRRTPSPVPSSAAAMAARGGDYTQAERENPDERKLDNIYKKKEMEEQELPTGEKKIAKKLFKCCLLNGGFTWMSIVLFDVVLLPMLKFMLTLFYGAQSETLPIVWSWVQPILSIIFGMMWVLPIFLLSKIVSSLWFADIANAAYRVRKGRPQLIPSISKLVADFLFSIVVQMLFLVQSMLVNLLPVKYVGEALCFLHLCLLYSLYSFEYKWFNMGWELHRRLSYIENNWPYFFGFGIPLTVLTNLTNSVIISSCIFSIFFPLFILSGNEAKPIVGTTELSLRLFSPVVFISNIFFGGNPWSARNRLSATQRQQLELQHQQRLLKEQQQRLKLQIREQQQREEEERTRERSRSRSSSRSTTPQFRYAQAPQFNAHKANSNAAAAATSSNSSSSSTTAATGVSNRRQTPYFGSAIRPIKPIPVPGAPKAPIQTTTPRTPTTPSPPPFNLYDSIDDHFKL